LQCIKKKKAGLRMMSQMEKRERGSGDERVEGMSSITSGRE
jgi:hypothetical protein